MRRTLFFNVLVNLPFRPQMIRIRQKTVKQYRQKSMRLWEKWIGLLIRHVLTEKYTRLEEKLTMVRNTTHFPRT